MCIKDEHFMKVYMSFFKGLANREFKLTFAEQAMFGALALNSKYGGRIDAPQKKLIQESNLTQSQASLALKGLVEKNIIQKKKNNLGIVYEFQSNLISKGSKPTPKITTHLKVINGKTL